MHVLTSRKEQESRGRDSFSGLVPDDMNPVPFFPLTSAEDDFLAIAIPDLFLIVADAANREPLRSPLTGNRQASSAARRQLVAD